MSVRPFHILFIEIICFLFIFLFSYAAISKLLDFNTFKIQLGQSPLLTAFAGWVAWVVPIIELITALLLAIPKYRLVALYGALGLMSLFTLYIIAILKFSDYVPCSCGGILENMGWQEHLIFNVIFLGLAMIGILITPSKTNASLIQNS
uniref:MauE/DoxX family redox-associated membrane protein n=1 Tax=Mariniflexile sp. TaxID=1979402 RepID=UPI004048BF54